MDINLDFLVKCYNFKEDIINLEFLERYNACNRFKEYFKTLEKQEWDVLELMVRCSKDSRIEYAYWLHFKKTVDFNKKML
jgi:hypothetical protein